MTRWNRSPQIQQETLQRVREALVRLDARERRFASPQGFSLIFSRNAEP
jgi:hypothetical protein